MSFLQEYAKRRKAEDVQFEAEKIEGTKSIAEGFYYLIRDIARAKYDVSNPDEKQMMLTQCDFMIWLDKGFRKAHKIKRSK